MAEASPSGMASTMSDAAMLVPVLGTLAPPPA
jgi:hypothetical protein